MNLATSLRATLLRLTLIFSCWWRTQSVLAANITVKNTDPSIGYQPAGYWHMSSETCSTCLKPVFSYHISTHPPPDEGDCTSLAAASSLNVAAMKVPAANTPPIDVPDMGTEPGDMRPRREERRLLGRRVAISRLDLEETNFVNPVVTVSFNFTGSALYLFAIQPQGANMNLSFTLDNQPSGSFHSIGTPGETGFNPNVPVFIKTDLEEISHHFIAHVGSNSTFLLDYIIYTSLANAHHGTSTSLISPMKILSKRSPTADSMMKKHNIVTFAVAVGCSVGVLAIFSLGLAISIIRRRRQSAKRDRLECQSESLNTNGSDNSTRTLGPAPFIPRFFPDTIIPPDPPTYTVASAMNPNNATLLASIACPGGPTSAYADIPPASPPPPLELLPPPPPPPFPIAVSIPCPQLTKFLPEAEHTQVKNSTSYHILGIAASNSISAAPALPNGMPLVREENTPFTGDRRPQSRPSSRSLRSSEIGT